MNDEKRAELLLDHHKDTFQHIRDSLKTRNRLFAYILIVLALVAFDAYSPGSLAELVNAYVAKTLHSESQTTTIPILDFSIVGSMARFLLLCLIVQYYQRSIQVDRQFKYIDHLERQICEAMGGDFVTREGKAYLSRTGIFKPEEKDKRPMYLRSVGVLDLYFFPLVLTIVVVFGLTREGPPPWRVTDIFNLVVVLAILLYTGLYLAWVRFRK